MKKSLILLSTTLFLFSGNAAFKQPYAHDEESDWRVILFSHEEEIRGQQAEKDERNIALAQAREIKRLITQGLDLNEKDKRGITRFRRTCRQRQLGINTVMFDHAAQFDLRDKDGRTALMRASGKGYREAVELLLELRAQVNLQCKIGTTALMWASHKGHREVADLLLCKGAEVDLQDKKRMTALMYASYEGHREVAELLLDHGAQVDLQDKDGKTALMWASRKGHIEVAEVLLDQGAQVDLQAKDGKTALREASWNSHQDIAQLLLDRGAQIGKYDHDWTDPAVECGGRLRYINQNARGYRIHGTCCTVCHNVIGWESIRRQQEAVIKYQCQKMAKKGSRGYACVNCGISVASKTLGVCQVKLERAKLENQ